MMGIELDLMTLVPILGRYREECGGSHLGFLPGGNDQIMKSYIKSYSSWLKICLYNYAYITNYYLKPLWTQTSWEKNFILHFYHQPHMARFPSPRSAIPHLLTHWGRVMHIWVSDLTTIASDNGLSPGRHRATIWTNAGILLIGSLGTNFSEISIEIQAFSLKKIHLKVLFTKWRSICLGLNVLTALAVQKQLWPTKCWQTVCNISRHFSCWRYEEWLQTLQIICHCLQATTQLWWCYSEVLFSYAKSVILPYMTKPEYVTHWGQVMHICISELGHDRFS